MDTPRSDRRAARRSRVHGLLEAEKRLPTLAFSWALYFVVLDAAAFLHGLLVVWIVLGFYMHWASLPDFEDRAWFDAENISMWPDFTSVVTILLTLWPIATVAAMFVCMRILRATQAASVTPPMRRRPGLPGEFDA